MENFSYIRQRERNPWKSTWFAINYIVHLLWNCDWELLGIVFSYRTQLVVMKPTSVRSLSLSAPYLKKIDRRFTHWRKQNLMIIFKTL